MAGTRYSGSTPQAYRKDLRARLAAVQASLLASVLCPGTTDVTSPVPSDSRNPIHVLLEHAKADGEATLALERCLDQKDPETATRDSGTGPDVEDVVRRALSARRLLLDTFARVSDDDLGRSVSGEPSPVEIMELRYVDSSDQVAEVVHWRGLRPAWSQADLRVLALATLRAARKELLTTIALIPENVRPDYTLQDGEKLAEYLALLTAGDRNVLAAYNVNAQNLVGAGTIGSDWGPVWRDLHATRQRLLSFLESLEDDVAGWGAQMQKAIQELLESDRSLAAKLRRSMMESGYSCRGVRIG